ncbi:hypothetical protein JCGZ_00772 [Jatropha curcas]|uniref:Uncharacterized protein n=1 Tax=Jatropha curcas TaxID=180498 RepID=A0A067L3D3_JATCU|nr:(-)-germacrene D synthase [Jatropha curcas]KDP39015.1 hypothetical protein JCGZ_00772 [Jatropha curcas]
MKPSSITNSGTASSALIPTINRRSANYHPNIWGDRFLSYDSNFMTIDNATHHQLEELKEEVRRTLVVTTNNSLQKLQLIDAIQRLGVDYHFEKEIEDELEKLYHENDDNENDLYTIALRFRLLRQQGFNASCEVFNQFKDDEGNFKKSLVCDAKGMLELYEATHVRVHGENTLDEALEFTTINLEWAATNLDYPLSYQISEALKQSIRKRLPRLEARRYVSFYQEDCSHNKALLKMAKLDFNLLQSLHKKELSEIFRWWKDLNFATKLPFARDRIVECYFWILSVFHEPQYSFARRILTKIIALASVLDDIYDVYGSLEELTLLTEIIQRWEVIDLYTEPLPEYMKHVYKALREVYREIEEELAKEGKFDRIQYAIGAMKEFVRSYYAEAKWLHEGYVPSMEEYMGVALVSSGNPMLTVTSFVGMGDIATKEALDWISNEPKIVRAGSTISRLMDDIVSYKLEKETGKIASAIECYKREYGVTEEEACNEFNKQIMNAWKDINQELLKPTAAWPMPLLMRPLNLARVMDILYKDGDNYTHVGKVAIDGITSLLIDPMS